MGTDRYSLHDGDDPSIEKIRLSTEAILLYLIECKKLSREEMTSVLANCMFACFKQDDVDETECRDRLQALLEAYVEWTQGSYEDIED